MDIKLAVEAYAMCYRAYHDALNVYIDSRDWEATHELDRARGHLQKAIENLHKAGIKVDLGALPETKEKLSA